MANRTLSSLSLPIRIRPARMVELDRLAAIGLAAWERGIAPLVPTQVWEQAFASRIRSDRSCASGGASIVVAESAR